MRRPTTSFARPQLACRGSGSTDAAAFDLLAAAVAVEALAYESSAAGVSLALHTGVTAGLDGDSRFSDLGRGEAVGAIALSSDDVPVEEGGRLSGRAAWVTPLTAARIAVLGVRSGDGLAAAAVC